MTGQVLPLVARLSADEEREWLDSLNAELAPEVEVRALADMSDDERRTARVAIVANPDPAKLAALPALEWIQSLWAGVERLVAEMPADGPKVVRLVDPQMAETMSEAVLAWTLYLHREMPRYARQQARRIWQEHSLKTPDQQTVALLGLGNLGKSAALRLKANGFNVIGWSRSSKTIDGIETFSGTDGLATTLSRADIAVLLMPLTPDTRGLINADTLGHMRPGAGLINFARGPIIDDTALLEALDSGRVGHAVLDVFAVEPLPDDHPYWGHPSVTVLPHISAPTTQSTASRIVRDNIRAYLETGTLPPTVDLVRGY